MNETNLKSPCVGVCSTVYGDDVCKGCKRYYDEVISWNAWDMPKQQTVYERLNGFMDEVMQGRLLALDAQKLEALLVRHGIDAEHFTSLYWKLYLLWVKKPSCLDCWDVVGAKLSDAYNEMTPNRFMNGIDDALNALAKKDFTNR